MPEGDTIHRTAAPLDRWLTGRRVTAARTTVARLPAATLVGQEVTGVEARGKHLLVRFSGGPVLHTHMRMTGSWHVYPAGQPWRKPAWQARLVLEAGDRVAVCFNAPVVELLAATGERRHPALVGLGPDILVPPLDLDEVRRRAATRPPETAVADLLLDQQVVAGIGNIWRCETLFVRRQHPWRPPGDLAPDELDGLVLAAADMMARSLRPAGYPGRDSGGGPDRPWVSGRSGRPCYRCRTPVASVRTGATGRVLYWCPSCQPG